MPVNLLVLEAQMDRSNEFKAFSPGIISELIACLGTEAAQLYDFYYFYDEMWFFHQFKQLVLCQYNCFL